ncbi:DMT family transporter [Psittacicella gerlachiana]|uniref:EamA domain-containing protein n=1 Tax=Psittacicella gerlachiana TaxID=2028574 RepID=A0A3A1YMJ4_9GAMM|nr:DMT family transporter [Psittacicella gerlachiana]RIY37484.1 hypothetical protein CKF59_01625 [Psittacicella gerlachiana]
MSDLSKGIFLVCFSAFASAIMALCYKLIAVEVSIYEKLFARGILSLTIAYSWIYLLRRQQAKAQQLIPAYFAQRGNGWLMLGRCLSGCLGILTYIYVVNFLSLADADMLTKLATVFIIIFGFFLFPVDKINAIQIGVVILSLIGAFLIIKPSFTNPLLGSYGMGILQAALAALSYIFIRYLLTKNENPEHPLTIESSLALFTVVVAIYPAYYYFTGWDGKLLAYSYLGLATIFALLAQYSFSFAMKYAPAVEVNVYQYSSLLWSSLFGWLFFAFIPDFLSLTGYLFIILGGLILYAYNLKQYRRQQKS